MPNNGLGFVQSIFAAATGALGLGTQIYAGREREKALKDAIKTEQRRQEDQRRVQEQMIRAAQQQRLEEAKLQLSLERRQEQKTALAVIVGGGLLVSGIFLYSALGKQKR